MIGHFSEHPLYQDDVALCDVTEVILKAGHTIFQLFQMPETEEDHALWLLQQADPNCTVRRVLSLGCGVGGMEAYWQKFRPELEFELVNISQSQLDRIRCSGRTVCANAEQYRSADGTFDLVVIAYLLGHVDAWLTLWSAVENLRQGGRLLVWDVFNGSERFRKSLFYGTPTFKLLEAFGYLHELRFRTVLEDTAHTIPLTPFFADLVPWVPREATAGLFVFQRA
jgi:SAM-dependent methyltransferase